MKIVAKRIINLNIWKKNGLALLIVLLLSIATFFDRNYSFLARKKT